MERMWAPWRMEYIRSKGTNDNCILCLAWEGNGDRERLVLSRSSHSLIMLNRFPYANGHIMVAPARHVALMDELADEELLDLMQCVCTSQRLMQQTAQPHGFNIGINVGKAAGAGIEDHLHIHIVPRWNGDTNFMAVIGDVRIISEDLQETYTRLAPVFRAGKEMKS